MCSAENPGSLLFRCIQKVTSFTDTIKSVSVIKPAACWCACKVSSLASVLLNLLFVILRFTRDQLCPADQCILPSGASPTLHLCLVYRYHQPQVWSSRHLITVTLPSLGTILHSSALRTHPGVGSETQDLSSASCHSAFASSVCHSFSDFEPDRKLHFRVSGDSCHLIWAYCQGKIRVLRLAAVIDLVG